jgi:DNA-directed RNA polymerase
MKDLFINHRLQEVIDPMLEKKSSIQKKNKKKMIKSFLPSFIHSLDGALMRIIIEKLYIKSKYIITHLHDSMRFHPNEYDNLIECIIDTYTELNFDILNKLIFDKMKENLLREDIPGIQKLIDDFTNFEKDEFEIKRETFNVKNMYRFP